METASTVKPTFEQAYPEVNRVVQSRRGAWTYLSLMEWADVSAILTEHIWMKWDQYDPDKGPLENWANTLITNGLLNLRRNLYLRLAKPCVGGGKSSGKSCVFNNGGDTCAYTKSGKQCSECPLYRDWQLNREHQFNIKSSVTLENHAQEVSSQPEAFCDIEGIKAMVDQQMKANLTVWEWHVYRRIYIQHLSPADTSAQLEALTKTWKRAPRVDEQWSYQFILTKQRWFRDLMFSILKREGYDLQAFIDYGD